MRVAQRRYQRSIDPASHGLLLNGYRQKKEEFASILLTMKRESWERYVQEEWRSNAWGITFQIATGKGVLKRNQRVKIDGQTIRRNKNIRYMGVMLDEKYDFMTHVENECEKALRAMNKIISIGQGRFKLSMKLIRLYHQGMLVSVVGYGAGTYLALGLKGEEESGIVLDKEGKYGETLLSGWEWSTCGPLFARRLTDTGNCDCGREAMPEHVVLECIETLEDKMNLQILLQASMVKLVLSPEVVILWVVSRAKSPVGCLPQVAERGMPTPAGALTDLGTIRSRVWWDTHRGQVSGVTCKCNNKCRTITHEWKVKLFEDDHKLDENMQGTFSMGLIHAVPVNLRQHGKLPPFKAISFVKKCELCVQIS
uniref:Uncharacterized protein n=1 Tax=Timema cristinae TaxID=61476 RepID=A0A7R9H150_TIMCR|nr:unnamed protein product [Timema cristinae]